MKMERKLIDEVVSLAKVWQDFDRIVIPAEASIQQKKDMRMCFAGGAVAVMDLMTKISLLALESGDLLQANDRVKQLRSEVETMYQLVLAEAED